MITMAAPWEHLTDPLDQQAELLQAIEDDDSAAIRKLLHNGMHPDWDIGIGCTPLGAAALHGSFGVVSALLEGGADVNRTDEEGQTALSLALARACAPLYEDDPSDESEARDPAICQAIFEGPHVKIGRLLLLAGARADTNNASVNEFFLFCCEQGVRNLVELLLDRGANVDAATSIGITALMHATSHSEVFSLLAARGANFSVTCKLGITVLDVLLGEGSLELAQLVIDRGADVNERNYFLTRAAEEGEYEVVRFLLRNGADPHRTNDRGATAFQIARLNGHSDVVDLLREALGWPSVGKVEAASASHVPLVAPPSRLGMWHWLLATLGTTYKKRFRRSDKEIFIRSCWLANEMAKETVSRFAPTAISSWIPDDRFAEEDRTTLFEVLAYESAYVLNKLNSDIRNYHSSTDESREIHTMYLASMAGALDGVFGLHDAMSRQFHMLLREYYAPDYDDYYRDFWAICRDLPCAASTRLRRPFRHRHPDPLSALTMTAAQGSFLEVDSSASIVKRDTSGRSDDEYNIERFYVYRLSRRTKIVDPGKVIASVLPYREIGLQFYDQAFFGLRLRAIERRLKRIANA